MVDEGFGVCIPARVGPHRPVCLAGLGGGWRRTALLGCSGRVGGLEATRALPGILRFELWGHRTVRATAWEDNKPSVPCLGKSVSCPAFWSCAQTFPWSPCLATCTPYPHQLWKLSPSPFNFTVSLHLPMSLTRARWAHRSRPAGLGPSEGQGCLGAAHPAGPSLPMLSKDSVASSIGRCQPASPLSP